MFKVSLDYMKPGLKYNKLKKNTWYTIVLYFSHFYTNKNNYKLIYVCVCYCVCVYLY